MRWLMIGFIFALGGCFVSSDPPPKPARLTIETRPSTDAKFQLVTGVDGLYLESPSEAKRVEPDDEGEVRLVDVSSVPRFTDEEFPDLLPDSVPAFGQHLSRVWLSQPTDRYEHGVLGDSLEAAALQIEVGEEVTTVSASEERVFEDLRPRLADFDGDGVEEVLVVRSSPDAGAQIAIYRADGTLYAESEHIGEPFRWLNPVGAADLDGDTTLEVAWVERPHLDATLRVASVSAAGFVVLDERTGHSNHVLGSTDIHQSLLFQDWIVVPAEAQTRLSVYQLDSDDLVEVASAPLSGKLATDIYAVGDQLVFGVRASSGEYQLKSATISP